MSLTNEDKEWIEARLVESEERVTEHLAERFSAYSALYERLGATEELLIERMRDMQTELAKAFVPFRALVNLSESTLEARQNTLEARQGILDRRLGEIEKKLLLPGESL